MLCVFLLPSMKNNPSVNVPFILLTSNSKIPKENVLPESLLVSENGHKIVLQETLQLAASTLDYQL